MSQKSQFTLAYLFWEIFWIATTFGLGRVILTIKHPSIVLVSLVFFGVSGASIGGLFGRMDQGALAGLAVWLIAAVAVCLYFLYLIFNFWS
jgi:hypothetical protein